jgi:hypothetical protein
MMEEARLDEAIMKDDAEGFDEIQFFEPTGGS